MKNETKTLVKIVVFIALFLTIITIMILELVFLNLNVSVIITIILLALLGIIELICAFLPYQIAYLSNSIQSYIRRKNTDDIDDEPSDFAVKCTHYTSVILLIILILAHIFYISINLA